MVSNIKFTWKLLIRHASLSSCDPCFSVQPNPWFLPPLINYASVMVTFLQLLCSELANTFSQAVPLASLLNFPLLAQVTCPHIFNKFLKLFLVSKSLYSTLGYRGLCTCIFITWDCCWRVKYLFPIMGLRKREAVGGGLVSRMHWWSTVLLRLY